ncbi:response regulator [Desulfovibrio sp. JC022]|uniref:response regulator n=1 Tax=Desulfovibrio sp. JC022 TaxID=2593642 RepID=UPI0013D21685|nr:response regulator [Desulfovibrio sp. JC022]NDV22884.1 response regulator [Desulfovibrio sp. JC022]
MKKISSYRLSTLVAAAICGMAIVTALAMGGVFSYSYFSTLKNEFHDRVRAEGQESSLELYSFLHRAMARLGELSKDNSIRVAMMMGVDYPLTEKLSEYDQAPLGIDFFVTRKGDPRIFSSSARPFDESYVQNALMNSPFRCSFCRVGRDGFITVFSLPIRSRSEVVGSAACLVDFSRSELVSAFKNSSGSRMVLFEQGKAYDLVTGESLSLSLRESVGGDELVEVGIGADVKGVLYRSSLVPGLAYFVSDARLNESVQRTFWLLLPLFGGVIGLCLVVSLYLSSKLTRPLRTITASAEDISRGMEEDIPGRESLITEISALSSALSSMLENLRRTRGLEQYQFFFDNVDDLVCITDMDGRFLKVNGGGADFLGYGRNELLKKTVFELVPPYERESLRSLLHSLFAGDDSRQFECPALAKSGEVVYADVRSRRITYQGQEVLLSVVRDVTDRKRDEEELQHYTAQLLKAKEVEERNSAHMADTLKKLEEAMAKAEVANRTKGEFLAQMSHEIRTPMNSILGMADMLSDTSLTMEQRSYVSIFRDSGKALMNLINDILDLSKIESGKLTLEKTKFNIDELVDEVSGIMSVSAWKKKLVFACHVDPLCPTLFEGDPTRIKQILVNLLSNAIKFTDSGSVVLDISSSAGPEGNVVLNMAVRDSGIGISEEKLKIIFENFVQADSSTTRKYGGTGLGLSITRNLVELMSGQISVRNVSSGGAEFRAEIQLGRVDEMEVDTGRIRSAMQDREILVIDERILVRKYICKCLNEWGAKCLHAGDLNFACVQSESCRSNAELVIVSDRLGEEDGLSEVEAIKARLNNDNPVLCTLSSSPGVSSNRPEVNQIFGVKSSVHWPVTRGGLQKAMLNIYGDSSFGKEAWDESIDLNPLRILVVDDSENNRMLLEFFLKDTPFRLRFATDGDEAVRIYRENNFDLVLMDIQMPVKNGLEATREIRAYEWENGYPATPVVAFTANDREEDRKDCLEAGCNGFLTKPIKKISLIKGILKHSI